MGSQNQGFCYSLYKSGSVRYRGYNLNGVREGAWEFFSQNGKPTVKAAYLKDSVINFTCFNEDGTQQTKDCIFLKEASFKRGKSDWVKWLTQTMPKYFPKKYTEGKLEGTVAVRFIVNEDGKVSNVEVYSSTEPELNDAAVQIIKASPDWNPAIQYNRKVKSYHTQPLTFKRAQ
jgi:TonB family protein